MTPDEVRKAIEVVSRPEPAYATGSAGSYCMRLADQVPALNRLLAFLAQRELERMEREGDGDCPACGRDLHPDIRGEDA